MRSRAEHGRTRRSRRLAILLASLVGGFLLLEFAVRRALFGGGEASGFTADLRKSYNYADPLAGDDYWKLFLRVEKLQPDLPERLYHPVLGWVNGDIDARTLAHAHAGDVGARRPVLLFGDSYAQCMNGPRRCFQGLVEASELQDQYCLLNYGVRGYGLDQTYLLLERTIDEWADRRPIVVIGFQVDEAVDRVVLSLRGWPKPRLHVVEGALVPETVPVLTAAEFLAQSPIGIQSYAWRYFVHGSGFLPERVRTWYRADPALDREKQALGRSIVEAIQEGLERRGIPYFFLLFHGEHFLSGVRRPDWREDLLVSVMQERRIPYVSASHALRDHARWYRHGVDRFFGRTGDARDHYLPLTNTVAFEALRAGLEQRFEPWGAPTIPDELGRGTVSSEADVWLDVDPDFESRERPRSDPQDQDRLCLRARGDQPMVVGYVLDGRCRRLSGLARQLADPTCAASAKKVILTIEADGATIFETELRAGSAPIPFEVDLTGRRELEVRVRSAEAGAECALVGLTKLRSL